MTDILKSFDKQELSSSESSAIRRDKMKQLDVDVSPPASFMLQTKFEPPSGSMGYQAPQQVYLTPQPVYKAMEKPATKSKISL